jgi:hypothetical protein
VPCSVMFTDDTSPLNSNEEGKFGLAGKSFFYYLSALPVEECAFCSRVYKIYLTEKNSTNFDNSTPEACTINVLQL